MYSNLTLYYLNQLGITPWVTKARYSDNKSKMKTKSLILVVKPAHLTDKEASLFNKLLDYITHNQVDILIIDSDSSDTLTINLSPAALLFLGVNPSDLSMDLNFNCPVFSSFSPDVFLKYPLEKKTIYTILNNINTLVKAI